MSCVSNKHIIDLREANHGINQVNILLWNCFISFETHILFFIEFQQKSINQQLKLIKFNQLQIFSNNNNNNSRVCLGRRFFNGHLVLDSNIIVPLR